MSAPTITLVKPTIATLIATLQTLDPNLSFTVEDADTGWTIDIIHIEQDKNGVFIRSNYDEMKA